METRLMKVIEAERAHRVELESEVKRLRQMVEELSQRR